MFRRFTSVLEKLILLLFLPSLLLNILLGFLYINQKTINQVKVIGVIDGDTIVLENKTRLRLRHIDAPELGLCGSDQAKNLLTTLVLNKKIQIKEQIPDQTGRSMALIYQNNTCINKLMLDSGWVRYHSDKTSQTDLLKTASTQAKIQKRGIYNSLCLQTMNSENPGCLIKGNLENKRKSGRKIYYLRDCAQYKFVQVEKDLGEQWFCTESEATQAGYIKADTCPR